MKIILPTFCFIFLLSSCAKFFVPDDYSDCILSEEVPKSYKKDCDAFRMNKHECANFYKRKINLKKHDKLQNIGVELFENGRPKFRKNYKEKVLIADAIIHGKVVSVTYDTTNVKYHSTYKIKIKDVLKGRFLRKHKYVFVKTMEGKAGKDRWISVPHEVGFAVGEEAFIYLFKKMEKDVERSKRYLRGTTFNFDLTSPNTFTPYLRKSIEGYAIHGEKGWINSHIAKWNILKTARIAGKDNFCEVYPSD